MHTRSLDFVVAHLSTGSIVPLITGLFLLPTSPAYTQVNMARDMVNPFIGTGGHGHTFPGACVPNGLVQLSPDTRPDGLQDWDGCSGYHYSDSLIYGFSHTHLSGTGVADLCDVLVMPMSGKPSLDPKEYRSPFLKTSESAHAGYYKVHLDGPNVTAELTATPRVGMHRYHFQKGSEAFVVLDLEHRDHTKNTSIVRVSDREVVGERRSSSWASDQRLFYCIRSSHPMKVPKTENMLASEITSFNAVKDYFAFGDLNGEPLLLKVGISAVSVDGARRNLEAEVPGWNFDAVQKRAEDAWNNKLGKIQVHGGTKKERHIFHSALYHCYVAPYIFNDVDGQYRGADGQVHRADHNVYTVFSLWDTFRTLHPLMTILEPNMTSDWIKTFLLYYEQSGRLPVWELWGNETDCMIGYHSVSVIADAYMKGIRGFDAPMAMEAMVTSARQDLFGLDAFQERGYISSEDEAESVSRTLEYAYDDACIAWMADAMGMADVAKEFTQRSQNWQNLYDPVTSFFRARRNGGFVDPFDPYEVNFHFTEANAWQYRLFVPHDLDRFTSLLGGKDELTHRLDAMFTAVTVTTGREQADITGLIGQYAHGNEPSHNYAYLYNFSGRPSSTEVYVSRIMKSLYDDAPDGLSGNEDCGQMSAWYVMSAMGFYPVIPGKPTYTTGLPLFDSCEIKVQDDKILRITTEVEAGSRAHVVQLSWNGEDLDGKRTLEHSDLVKGGSLSFLLGPRPGSASSEEPSAEDRTNQLKFIPVPLIQSSSASFVTDLEVTMNCSDKNASINYRTNDGPWVIYNAPFTIDVTSRIEAIAVRQMLNEGQKEQRSIPVIALYTQVEGGRTVTVESKYANHYAAGGDQALVDGLRGGKDYRAGGWQGTQGEDVIVTIDLGRPMRIGRVGIGVLQDQKSWIWYPKEVEFVFSSNGRQWSSVTATHDVPKQLEGSHTMDLWSPLVDKKARYVKVIAHNAGPCPDWHQGHGGSTWIFVDEFLIETN